MVLIRACIDECSTHDDPKSPMLMYGCVSTLAKWERFDKEWRKLLERYNIPYVHAKSLVLTQHPFNDGSWTRKKKLAFTLSLEEVIRRRMGFCFSTVLKQEDFDEYRRHKKLSSILDSKYGVSARVALSFLHQRCQFFYGDKNPSIFVLYENGDPHAGAFPELLEKMRKAFHPCFVRSVVPVEKSQCYGTQAADLHAYVLLNQQERKEPRFIEFKDEQELMESVKEKTEERPFPVFRLPITRDILIELRDNTILSKRKFTRLYGHLLSSVEVKGRPS